MRGALISSVFLLNPALVCAQGNAILSGRVLDMQGDAPISFAAIAVESPTAPAGSPPIGGALAGENGRFVIQGLAPGQYRVRITFSGFVEAETDVVVSPLNQTYDLGDIRLPRIEGFKEQIWIRFCSSRRDGRSHCPARRTAPGT